MTREWVSSGDPAEILKLAEAAAALGAAYRSLELPAATDLQARSAIAVALTNIASWIAGTFTEEELDEPATGA